MCVTFTGIGFAMRVKRWRSGRRSERRKGSARENGTKKGAARRIATEIAIAATGIETVRIATRAVTARIRIKTKTRKRTRNAAATKKRVAKRRKTRIDPKVKMANVPKPSRRIKRSDAASRIPRRKVKLETMRMPKRPAVMTRQMAMEPIGTETKKWSMRTRIRFTMSKKKRRRNAGIVNAKHARKPVYENGRKKCNELWLPTFEIATKNDRLISTAKLFSILLHS